MQRHPVARCLLAVAAAAPAAPRCQLMTAHCLQVRHEPHLLRDRPLHLGGAHGAVPRMLAGRIEASGCRPVLQRPVQHLAREVAVRVGAARLAALQDAARVRVDLRLEGAALQVAGRLGAPLLLLQRRQLVLPDHRPLVEVLPAPAAGDGERMRVELGPPGALCQLGLLWVDLLRHHCRPPAQQLGVPLLKRQAAPALQQPPRRVGHLEVVPVRWPPLREVARPLGEPRLQASEGLVGLPSPLLLRHHVLQPLRRLLGKVVDCPGISVFLRLARSLLAGLLGGLGALAPNSCLRGTSGWLLVACRCQQCSQGTGAGGLRRAVFCHQRLAARRRGHGAGDAQHGGDLVVGQPPDAALGVPVVRTTGTLA
mmetsp:Transcript_34855/g.87293  ORF Transcript_34855/g.87293 Transcript_34855/m.87293 type:complete len:368 (-) Transcript_34855:738-1841(-)